jgi:hypothetical protein
MKDKIQYPDGCINIDTPFAKTVGMTSDKFRIDTYLWKNDNQVVISNIASLFPGKGNLRKLVDSLETLGYNVCVPTPSERMIDILTRMGFNHILASTPDGDCEMMLRPGYIFRVPQ